MGSIDTISYDPNYENIVKAFQKTTSSLVYHVIESNDSLSLLFVSNDETNWDNERPTLHGVFAQVISRNGTLQKTGYIHLDNMQGALYRRDNKIDTSPSTVIGINAKDPRITLELERRISILNELGMLTDLPIVNIYDECQEICFSNRMNLFGEDMMIINRLSSNPTLMKITERLQKQVPLNLFFLVGPIRKDALIYLFISDDNTKWEEECDLLLDQMPAALIFNLNNMTATIQQIHLGIKGGGPIVLDIL